MLILSILVASSETVSSSESSLGTLLAIVVKMFLKSSVVPPLVSPPGAYFEYPFNSYWMILFNSDFFIIYFLLYSSTIKYNAKVTTAAIQ